MGFIEKLFYIFNKSKIEEAQRKMEEFRNSPEMKAKEEEIKKQRKELAQLAAQDENLANFFNDAIDKYHEKNKKN